MLLPSGKWIQRGKAKLHQPCASTMLQPQTGMSLLCTILQTFHPWQPSTGNSQTGSSQPLYLDWQLGVCRAAYCRHLHLHICSITQEYHPQLDTAMHACMHACCLTGSCNAQSWSGRSDVICVLVCRLQHQCSRRCVTCWHILAHSTSSRCSTSSDLATEDLPLGHLKIYQARQPPSAHKGKALRSQKDVRLGDERSHTRVLQKNQAV